MFVGLQAGLADEIEDGRADFAGFERGDVGAVEPGFEDADGQFDVVLDLVRQAGLIQRERLEALHEDEQGRVEHPHVPAKGVLAEDLAGEVGREDDADGLGRGVEGIGDAEGLDLAEDDGVVAHGRGTCVDAGRTALLACLEAGL